MHESESYKWSSKEKKKELQPIEEAVKRNNIGKILIYIVSFIELVMAESSPARQDYNSYHPCQGRQQITYLEGEVD